ncbi:hypothetical protein F8M41_023125 [Gigaspora margarita]|uniref:Uncharacterized protein n=1 Tax=Gigaspora margarita TaxID=4874 RepID=A0A8H4ADZ9_GIGMA|nr:hypothetical protein F8M41_023125 [Gigaspora margarita]
MYSICKILDITLFYNEKDEKKLIKEVIATIKEQKERLKVVKKDEVVINDVNDEVKIIITMIYKDDNHENENCEMSEDIQMEILLKCAQVQRLPWLVNARENA